MFIEKSASPSVAQLAGKFQDQKTVPGKEVRHVGHKERGEPLHECVASG